MGWAAWLGINPLTFLPNGYHVRLSQGHSFIIGHLKRESQAPQGLCLILPPDLASVIVTYHYLRARDPK